MISRFPLNVHICEMSFRKTINATFVRFISTERLLECDCCLIIYHNFVLYRKNYYIVPKLKESRNVQIAERSFCETIENCHLFYCDWNVICNVLGIRSFIHSFKLNSINDFIVSKSLIYINKRKADWHSFRVFTFASLILFKHIHCEIITIFPNETTRFVAERI